MMELARIKDDWSSEKREELSEKIDKFANGRNILNYLGISIGALETIPKKKKINDDTKDIISSLIINAKKIQKRAGDSNTTPFATKDDLLNMLEEIESAKTPEEIQSLRDKAKRYADYFEPKLIDNINRNFGSLHTNIKEIILLLDDPRENKTLQDNLKIILKDYK